MPPKIESQMLRGVTLRKRNLLENRCTMTKPNTASSETTVTTDIAPRYPLLDHLQTNLRVAEKTNLVADEVNNRQKRRWKGNRR